VGYVPVMEYLGPGRRYTTTKTTQLVGPGYPILILVFNTLIIGPFWFRKAENDEGVVIVT
jgi:hypothetical protein